MRIVAALVFLAGLVLGVRVMFFGVQRRVDAEHFAHRVWPLALALFLMVLGAILYGGDGLSAARLSTSVVAGLTIGGGAWWLVKRSAVKPSMDPEDDPRYRFQGHIARVVKPIAVRRDDPAEGSPGGRITFTFDGTPYDLRAEWASAIADSEMGDIDREVVIERIEGDVAYVEPWTVVEQRL